MYITNIHNFLKSQDTLLGKTTENNTQEDLAILPLSHVPSPHRATHDFDLYN